MKTVNIMDLSAGMVLSKDVHSANGRLLLEQGTTLDDNHLRVLNMWGVSEVEVLDDSEVATESETWREFIPEAEGIADRRFAAIDLGHLPFAELRKQCVFDHARRLEQGWRPASPPETPPEDCPPTGEIPCLEAMTSSDSGLVSLPDIYFHISKALEDPACTAARLADIISKDAGMSARLLRLVNSPAMSRGRKIDTLSRSVVILGIREISQLALGISVMSMFRDISAEILPATDFWKHSLACGVMAQLLANRMGKRDLERFFVAGMLHDLGRLVMLRLAPQTLCLSIRKAYAQKICLRQAERLTFGFDHCEVAEKLMLRWQLPSTLSDVITWHHAPAQSNQPQEAAIVNVADAVVIALQYGHSGQFLCTGMAPGAWELLGLSPSVLSVVISQAQRQLNDIYAAFLD